MTARRSPIFRNSDEGLRRLEREAVSDPAVFRQLELARERTGSGFTAWVESTLAREAGRGRVEIPTLDDSRKVVRAVLVCPQAFCAELNYGVNGTRRQLQTHSSDLCNEWIQSLWTSERVARPKKKRIFMAAVLDGDFVTVGIKAVFLPDASIRQAWDDEIGAPARAERHYGSRALMPHVIRWSRRVAPDRRRTTVDVAWQFASSVRLPSFYRVWAGQQGTPCEHVDGLVPAEEDLAP